MSTQLDKAYDPKKYEAKLYAQWEESGAFKPEGNVHLRSRVEAKEASASPAGAGTSTTLTKNAPHVSRPEAEVSEAQTTKAPFSIIMPPPNANGNLHVGHAMFVVEDIMTRYRRMQGHPTLWLPGADHAGIETQVVYESLLAKEGRSRFDFTREQFYTDVMIYTRTNMGTMIDQMRSLGFSPDWSRLKFTLDDDIVATVYDTFKRLHDDGLIYRANRLVNWCPHCRSGFADIEIKHREQIDPLYYIKYGPFVLATVRPETKFGDTAIAVSPKDERYTKLVGTEIEAQSVLDHTFKIRVIADDHVDPAFGTGAVKVTPAHDPNDWEMGVRHNLEVVPVIGTDGLMLPIAGKYAGMTAADARVAVAEDMEAKGLMDHVDLNYTHSIGYHDRCGTPIEPLVIEQWWLKVDELKKPAIEAVKNGDIKIIPERFTQQYLNWMDGLHDWNISRQNWWGIRVPVYYNATGDTTLPPYIITTDEAEAIKTYGQNGYEAETDNFDTWFSSGQWPFATLMATDDFDKGFFPTSVMGTAREILYIWVARMIMFSLYRTKQVPFRTVYLWGLVTDEHGTKMSKSKGNVVNPLEVTAKYGTDALRLALTIGITPGNNGSVSERKIEGYRNFCNKLWNVARFILGQLPEDYSPTAPTLNSPADHWMSAKLDTAVINVTQSIEEYRFSDAGQLIYSLLWDDFADWYLEASKVSPNHDLLVHTLETILQLLHPIAPFVTEAIWSELPWRSESQLITTAWPVVDKTRTDHPELVANFDDMKAVVQAARTLIAEEQLSKATILTTDPQLIESADLIKRLAKAGEVKLVKEGNGLYLNTTTPAWIEADAELIAARQHRLEAQRTEKQGYLKSLEAKLANTRYVESAPAAVVEQTKQLHTETESLLAKLNDQLDALTAR